MLYLGHMVIAFAALAAAVPTRRDVSSDDLKQMQLFSEYSAASYCMGNTGSKGNAVKCGGGFCPTVQAADTNTLAEFDHGTDYGDVAGFLAEDKTNKLLVLSFRGSRTPKNWVANLNFGLTNASELCRGCEVHKGFWKAWNTVADDMTSKLEDARKSHPDYTIVFTGHSFGGAMAMLGGTALRNAGYKIKLYTYGEPRVGNEALAKYVTSKNNLWRVTHKDDIVPKVPPSSFGYSHASPEYWITTGNGNKTIHPSDVKKVQGVGSKKGNAGTLNPDILAHNWYFGNIDFCIL